jgi:hypothetical protein
MWNHRIIYNIAGTNISNQGKDDEIMWLLHGDDGSDLYLPLQIELNSIGLEVLRETTRCLLL